MAKTAFSLIDLPWLPRPSSDFRPRLEAVRKPDLVDWLPSLRGLASEAINLNQAISLARTLKSLQARHPSPALASFRLGIVSNGTTDFLQPMLEVAALRHGIALEICSADFGQAMQEALNPASSINTFRPDAVLLALDYRGLPFRRQASGAWPPFEHANALAELQALRQGFRKHSGAISLVQTVAAPPQLEFGSLELSLAGSLRSSLCDFNRAVADSVREAGDLLIDVDWIAQSIGLDHWYDDRNWYIARMPMAQRALPLYADFVARVPAAMRGLSRKCLVLDLDNTIWGGVVGDDGMEGLALNPGDARGEAFRAIQSAAADLRRRGIVLAVCSKNDESTAREAFRSHPGMILKETDIAIFVANWHDKASNLERIASQLDIGLNALVMLDDNPAERALIRHALPQVAVPELGDDPSTFVRTLLCAGYFEPVALTGADLARAEQYGSNAARAHLLHASRDLDGFLRSLEMTIRFEQFNATGRKRIAQLINKTNQFNVTTRRYTEVQVAAIEASSEHHTLQISVSDRFGDNGMIGVVICRMSPVEWLVDTWLMSCRVLNRRIEESVCNHLASVARNAGARRLVGEYQPTERNRIVADLFARLGFDRQRDSTESSMWVLDLERFTPFDVPVRPFE